MLEPSLPIPGMASANEKPKITKKRNMPTMRESFDYTDAYELQDMSHVSRNKQRADSDSDTMDGGIEEIEVISK